MAQKKECIVLSLCNLVISYESKYEILYSDCFVNDWHSYRCHLQELTHLCFKVDLLCFCYFPFIGTVRLNSLHQRCLSKRLI